jgi:hypothetical protein
MGFRATNFTITTLLLVAFTVFIAGVRNKKSLDSNWPLIYWGLVLVFTLVRPEDSFDYRLVMLGLAMALLLRFEFMNEFFVKTTRVIEMVLFVYVVIRGLQVAFGF